jgi:hypothetical protein
MNDDSLREFLTRYATDKVVQRYLEVGCRDGDSLRCVVGNSKTLGVVYLADTWAGEYGGTARGGHGHIDDLLDSLGYRGRRVFLDGDSRVTLPRLDRAWADLVLVDGDHSAEGAKSDLDNCWRLLTVGGSLVFHDICHPSHGYLEAVFNQFANERAIGPDDLTFDRRGHGLAVARKAKG